MVLGARTLDDKGCVLFYSSGDLESWKYDGTLSTPDFGYMWECPDLLDFDGHEYLSVSPQGLEHGDTKIQNVYQSGYFRYDSGLKDFTEWDMGFDFYAPQTFVTPDGRRIIIGWMGIGDIPYSNPTVPLGYQHCLTLPREITVASDGRLLQNPIRELLPLRGEKTLVNDGGRTVLNSRMYPESDKVSLSVKGLNADVYTLTEMEALTPLRRTRLRFLLPKRSGRWIRQAPATDLSARSCGSCKVWASTPKTSLQQNEILP